MAKFAPGDTVIHLVTGQKGIVREVLRAGRGRQLYRVYFDKDIESCLEQNLDFVFEIDNPFELCKKGRYGTRDQFALVNTTYKINNSNNNTISSLKASKTLFKAYQFKPLLKFLESQGKRILIADEVGLGKTIEAGHILLELKARGEFKSALIVCPNSLKIKWQTELKEKFGLDFKIYESLNDAIGDLKAHPQSARGILNYEKIRAKKPKEDENGKIDVNEPPTNDLINFLSNGNHRYSAVLCDEAHKLRTHTTQQYRGMEGLLEWADAVVFLTATPIMLGEDDLYNLLHLLEPLNFDNREVFANMLNANRPFIQAVSMLNANAPFSEIRTLLVEGSIEETHTIGEYTYKETKEINEIYKDIPVYEHILTLLKGEDSHAVRAELQSLITSLSSINNVFSRTRKREVSTDERQQTERNAHKCLVKLNGPERELFDAVIDNYVESKGGTYINDLGEKVLPQGAILGIIQHKRMISSSVPGYQLLRESHGDLALFCRMLSDAPLADDAKIKWLQKIIGGVKETGGNKLIVFSGFKFTVRYLESQLQRRGFKVFAIHGDIKNREEQIRGFRDCKDFSILLSTEVGSEGLDMQFCSHMVNYDLPWNPMVVEQRIGRIDRFGQPSPKIHIYNLVVTDSIQEEIYDRLLVRIGIFQGAIGELEMILEEKGELINKLEQDLYGLQLSKEEQKKKIRDVAKACETEKIDLEQVEEGLNNTLTNDIYFKNEISKIRNEKLYVTEKELINYVKMLVTEHLKSCTFTQVSDNEYEFIVPKSTKNILGNFLTSNQPSGDDFADLFRIYKQRVSYALAEDNRLTLTFDQKFAFENKEADYVNLYNPIIVSSSVHFKKSIDQIGKTFQLKLKDNSGLLCKGYYFLAVYVVTTSRTIMGRTVSSDLLVPVMFDVDKDHVIDDKDLNLQIFGTIQDNSVPLTTEEAAVAFEDEVFDNIESDFSAYIAGYIKNLKQDLAFKDDSQRKLRLRQLESYYAARIEKEKINVNEAQYEMEWTSPEHMAKAQNKLRLAENRLRKLYDDKAQDLERVNTANPPTISSKLISLTKILIN